MKYWWHSYLCSELNIDPFFHCSSYEVKCGLLNLRNINRCICFLLIWQTLFVVVFFLHQQRTLEMLMIKPYSYGIKNRTKELFMVSFLSMEYVTGPSDMRHDKMYNYVIALFHLCALFHFPVMYAYLLILINGITYHFLCYL